jgi:AcrR family transcriptional regulator
VQQRAATTRRAIIDAAAEMFEKRGFSGTTLREIVDSRKVTKGALYFHFKSKDALAAAVIGEHYDLWPSLVSELRGRHTRAIALLVSLSLDVAVRFRDDSLVRGAIRLVFERDLIAEPVPRPFVGWITTVTGLLTEARAQEDLLEDVDIPDAARLVVASFTGVQQVAFSESGRRDLLPQVGVMWRYLLPGLVTPECAGTVAAMLPRRPIDR